MKIDLTKIFQNYTNSLNINEEIKIPLNYLSTTLIKDLKNTTLIGKIYLDEEDTPVLSGKIKGTMHLLDDVTLTPVEYEFSTEIEENLEKYQNILDITDILWQNILMEVPSKVHSTNEEVSLSGDGWRVISEEQYQKERNQNNNPFSDLDKLLNNTKEDR